MTHEGLRNYCTFTHAVETLMHPIEDGTKLRITVALQSLQIWRDVHTKLLQKELGTLSVLKGVAAMCQH